MSLTPKLGLGFPSLGDGPLYFDLTANREQAMVNRPVVPGQPRAVIVGGGLAGMVAALKLANRGFRVDLYEGFNRVGGKAGSDEVPWGYSDHGYHIFPDWYLNLWALVRELQIEEHFYKTNRFYRLDALVQPRVNWQTIRKGRQQLWDRVWELVSRLALGFERPPAPFKSALISPRVALSVVDLCSRRNSFVSDLSLKGFLRSRYYNSYRLGTALDDLVLKAISIQSYAVSARTMRNTFRQWLTVIRRGHSWTALKGSLQTLLIAPIEEAIAATRNCRIHLNHRLTEVRFEPGSNDIATLHFERVHWRDADEAPQRGGLADPVDVRGVPVVLAIPPDGLKALLNAETFSRDRRLHGIEYLRTDPLGGFDVVLKQEFEFSKRFTNGFTREHFSLEDSKYALSVFDISQHWQAGIPENRTVLQVVAGDVTALDKLPKNQYEQEVVGEVAKYLGFDPRRTPDGDVEDVIIHKNTLAPLVMNDVGSWSHRPAVASYDDHESVHRRKQGIHNLYLAGDFVRSEVDVACMESAVTTGLVAAEEVRRDYARATTEEIAVIAPRTVSVGWMTLWRWVFGPIAFVAARGVDELIDWLRGRED